MFGKSTMTPESAASSVAHTDASGERRRSVLHEGITIRGEWTSDGIIDFGGIFEGDLSVDTLILGRTGRINGTVSARTVTVEGHFEGSINAQNVMIKSSAQVVADILTQNITIDAGAEIEGKVSCRKT
jgi:cytoskeletal protein CcmA (bactofilin family)